MFKAKLGLLHFVHQDFYLAFVDQCNRRGAGQMGKQQGVQPAGNDDIHGRGLLKETVHGHHGRDGRALRTQTANGTTAAQ